VVEGTKRGVESANLNSAKISSRKLKYFDFPRCVYMTQHVIGESDEFTEGKGMQVDVDGINVAIFRIDGELYGIQNMCPHKRYPIHLTGHETVKSEELAGMYGDDDEEGQTFPPTSGIKGKIDNDDLKVYCPWHHLDFDVETGECDVTHQQIATYDVEEKDNGEVVLSI